MDVQVEELIKLVHNLLDEVRSYSNEIEPINVKIDTLKENVDKLVEIISGSPPGGCLATRIALNEAAIKALEKAIDIIRVSGDKEVEHGKEVHILSVNKRWAMYTALATGILALVASIINFYLK